MKTSEEIAVIKNEVKHLTKQFEMIVPKINEMHETFIRGEGKINLNKTKINTIELDINGNGKPGIKQELNLLKNQLRFYAGGLAVLVTLLPIILHIFW